MAVKFPVVLCHHLLIEPKGIEIYQLPALDVIGYLLIEPKGIEIPSYCLPCCSMLLLIEPKGIEMQHPHEANAGYKPINRTKRN